MDLLSVDSDEAMKRGYEALNASSLQFLRRVKCFIATILSLLFPPLISFRTKHTHVSLLE
jgi:hypothetical protein